MSDLFGIDPNFTLGMDATRYVTHQRGDCPADERCALCLLEEAEHRLRSLAEDMGLPTNGDLGALFATQMRPWVGSHQCGQS